jgi:hypothetical protein
MQVASTARPLPGIRFEAAPRTSPDALPRMDVAAFVGFAARGPVNRPVSIEDSSQFRAVFGDTVTLAWDRARGQWTQGHLAGTVDAFFANGGARCWVVRVAGEQASSNRFALRGLGRAVSGPHGWVWQEAVHAQARCEGSWSDNLRVNTRLRSQPVWLHKAEKSGDTGAVALWVRSGTPLQPGDLLRVSTPGEPPIFVPISAVQASGQAGGSLAICLTPLRIHNQQLEMVTALALGHPDQRVDLVTMDLRVTDARTGQARTREDLGLVPGHARYGGLLRTDDQLFDEANDAAALADGFPLACDWGNAPGADLADPGFCIPWQVSDRFNEGDAAAPERDGKTRLERDGLDRLDASLFMDRDLQSSGRAGLMDLADVIRYRNPQPRRLSGLHAVLGWGQSAIADEVTMVAVPDAVHRPWQRTPATLPAQWFEIDQPDQQANTSEPAVTFYPCLGLPAPQVHWLAPSCTASSGPLQLRWQAEGADINLAYRVERSVLPDFASPDLMAEVRGPLLDIRDPEAGAYFFRVRAERDGCPGPWSTTLRIHMPTFHDHEIDPQAEASGLLPVHLGLLRMAAARGDMLALLSMPLSWSDEAQLAHAQQLRDLDVQDSKMPTCASFGALHHAWSIPAAGAAAMQALPPDGWVAGVLARRAQERGAWVPAANLALRDVVALAQAVPPARWAACQDAGINVLRQEPWAFTVLSQDTLSADAAARSIHVRRLLTLLRKLAVRLGAEFAFEPQNDSLHGVVESRFDQALEGLFTRGAFSGRRASDAYQVTVSRGGGPPTLAHESQLVVELRVRPASALRLLTVRLTQSGSQAGVAEVM